ncbi:MAG: glycoside hydrolase family 16 protein [Flavobacteriaceae bacterium]
MNHKFLSVIVVMLFFVTSCNKEKNSSDENSQPQNENNEYQLVWSDDFEENIINEDNWTFEIWDAGRVNNEWQQYVENTDNYKLENGFLHIIVTKTGANEKGGYTSTRLVSKGKKEFKYGRLEFRAKMPKGVGTWPALWMLGSNINEVGWPKCGEIDIMEYVGFQPDTTHTNVHTKYQSGTTDFHVETPLTTAEEDFHIYGLTWTSSKLEFYLDDPNNITNTYAPSVKTIDNWPFDQPFFMIMNFAVGGNWGGKNGVDDSIWPQEMVVDYVKVYQLK